MRFLLGVLKHHGSLGYHGASGLVEITVSASGFPFPLGEYMSDDKDLNLGWQFRMDVEGCSFESCLRSSM